VSSGEEKIMKKMLVLTITGVVLFYVLVHVSPALALLSMVTVITSPMFKLSLEIAQTEDRRVRNN
jgi:hypothetical protein